MFGRLGVLKCLQARAGNPGTVLSQDAQREPNHVEFMAACSKSCVVACRIWSCCCPMFMLWSSWSDERTCGTCREYAENTFNNAASLEARSGSYVFLHALVGSVPYLAC